MASRSYSVLIGIWRLLYCTDLKRLFQLVLLSFCVLRHSKMMILSPKTHCACTKACPNVGMRFCARTISVFESWQAILCPQFFVRNSGKQS